MAKILSFRSKEGTSAGQTFLTDEAEKLSFHTAEDGAVSLNDIPAETLDTLPTPTVFADPSKDWTNQELADLFRVRRLLSGANVPVETMRGVTDEGDPWFLFCHLNGDVFIHMARIDGFYVLDSPNVQRPLRGVDFNGLLDDFTDGALPAQTSDEDGEENTARVVRLERGGKVRLHPSAMLAALIWTLFLASEELVMMLPDAQPEGSDDLLDFSDIIAADTEFAALETEGDDAADLIRADGFKIDHEETIHTTADGQPQMRDAMAQQGLAMQQNAYAMGLSTIAIAMGFISEAVLMDDQRKVLEGLKALGLSQHADGTHHSDPDQAAANANDPLIEKLAAFLNLDLSNNVDMAVAAKAPVEDALSQQEMLHVSTAAVDLSVLPSAKTIEKLAKRSTDDAEAAPVEELTETTYDADTLILIAAAQQQADSSINMADLVNGQLEMEEFELGGTTVMASFDLGNSDKFSLSDYLVMGQRNTDHRSFDDQARAFIDFIQAKETEVGIVTIGNEIIMIDRDAFRHDGAETYSFSWETYDGQVISMIGLRSEFQEFDLIA